MMPHHISLALIRDLTCRHCGRYVTCGPVHVVPDGSILCGRCRTLAKPKFRNYALEAIGSLYEYPCYNWTKYCPKVLNWNESLEHEPVCIYNSNVKLLCSRPSILFKSDRKIPEVQNQTVEYVNDKLLEILKCSICESYLSCSPVYIGEDGKNVCHRCIGSNGLPPNHIQNLAYEKLASCLMFPCIYRYRGCTRWMRYGRNMWEHETDCEYGQIYKKASQTKSSHGGKERGVIKTQIGHHYGTITEQSSLFSPPQKGSDKNNKMVYEELWGKIKKKQPSSEDSISDQDQKNPELKRFPSYDHQSMSNQSLDSVFDHNDDQNLDQQRKQQLPSIDYHYEDHDQKPDDASNQYQPRPSYQPQHTPSISRPSTRDSDYPPDDNSYQYHHQRQDSERGSFRKGLSASPVKLEQELPYSGDLPYNEYHDNILKFERSLDYNQQLPHFYADEGYPPPPSIKYTPSLKEMYDHRQRMLPKRSESMKVGNPEIIEELKLRQLKKKQEKNSKEGIEENPFETCNNLEDIVKTHDAVFPS